VTDIPRHPFVPYRALAEGFAEKHVPGYGRRPFLGAMALWRKVFGIDEAETQIWQDIQEDRDGFYHSDWIFRSLFYPQVVASFLCEVAVENGPKRAAQALHTAMEFYLRARDDKLEPEFIGGYPQDMERYKYFFSRPTISTFANGLIRHTVTLKKASD